jgi:hypothetical protein
MPGDANAPADCAHEKDLQMQVFSKRLKGFAPSTFSWQAVGLRHLGCRNACKSGFPGAWTARFRSRNYAEIPGV